MRNIILSIFLLATPPAVAQIADWQTSDDQPDQRRVAGVAPSADGTPYILPLELPDSGYVVLRLPADRADIVTRLLDATGNVLGDTAARVALPDGAVAEITLPPNAEPLALDIRYWPEIDVTEPNDDPVLAWPIQLRRRQSVTLFPAGDVDYFVFELPDAQSIRLHRFGTETLGPVVIVNAETGDEFPTETAVELPAGQYALRFSGSATNEPEVIEFALAQELDIPLTHADGTPLLLAIGQPQIVPEGVDPAVFDMRIDQAGLYSFVSRALGPEVTYQIENAAGETLTGSQVHLASGDYQLTVSGAVHASDPGFIVAYRGNIVDANEPNDFRTDATRLEPDIALPIVLESNAPLDWFVLTAPANGRFDLFLESEPHNCDYVWLSRADPVDPEDTGTLNPSGSPRRLNFTPVHVQEGETVELSMTCAQIAGSVPDARLLARFTPEGETLTSVENDSSIYVVGLELTDPIGVSLANHARDAGVNFVEAEDAAVLDRRIREISHNETSGRFPWWILVLLFLMGVGGYVGYRFYLRKMASNV